MSETSVTDSDIQDAENQMTISAEAASLFNQANSLYRAGSWSEAEGFYQQVVELEPLFDGALLQIARCRVNRGDDVSARTGFETLLRAFPDNFSGWLEAGHLCRKQGVTDQAVISYKRAIAINPQRYEGHISLARVLEDLSRFELAAPEYHWALVNAGADKVLSVHWRMAKYRLERGDAARALESMRQALLIGRLAKEPLSDNERAEMQIDLGDVMMRLGMTDDAHRAFERASIATEEATLVRLAELSFRYNLWQEAQAVLKRNVELHPDSAMAHWNLAHSYAESWQMEDALLTLEKAEAIAPQPGAMSMRASVAGRIGDVEQALALYRQLAEKEGPYSKMRSSAAMSALYSDQLSAQEVADLHRELFAPLAEKARVAESFKNDRSLNRRLKVGLISADFHHQHPVNIFMQPVLARLDPKQFELTMYFTGISYDDQTQLAKRRVAHWVEATTWSDLQLARRIEADQIDILLDLAGHTSMQRMSLFGQRAAPVQASFLGYPSSTGVPNIDWLIADSVVAPTEHESLYSEKVMRLPNTVFCFAPETQYPFPDYNQSHAQRPLTFGSFNNVPKLTPHTLKLWASILEQVPGSKLLLKAPSFKDESAIKIFTQRLLAEGVDPSRLEFRGPVGLTDMMAEYADVDIALDPVPYNGGTTTLQAMWMGVPVVVKAGNNFVSRMGASFMSAADLGDWVAETDADYVQIAKQMAADRQALLNLKKGLRQRLLNSPAWDVDQYAKDFGDCLHKMWTGFVAE
jgi:predicted O-linked N-acetylglucosamine transferase (SPINDLY family)